MTRHIVITGLPGSGSAALHDLLSTEAEDLDVVPGEVPALTVMGRPGTTCTHAVSDLFATPEIAIAAMEASVHLDIVVVNRDPRDQLLACDAEGAHVCDGETLLLIRRLLSELERAGIVAGEILALRAEDVTRRPETVRATIADRLGLNLRPADHAKADAPAPLWRDPEARDRLMDQFRQHPGLHDLLQAQGYETSLDWYLDLLSPTRNIAPGTRPLAAPKLSWTDGMSTLHEDATMKVSILDSEGPHAIMTFIGVGMKSGGIDHQSEEFRKLGAGLGPQLFVFDKTRSWGNAIDLPRLIEVTRPFRSGRDVTNLGLSMGGFLATLTSGCLGAARVIALAPQYSVHPDIAPFESRWLGYTRRITDWPHPSLDGTFEPGCTYYVLCPDDPVERAHLALFPRQRNVHRFLFDAGHHNVAASLKAHDLLYPTIWACIRDEAPDGMPFACREQGGIWQVTLGAGRPPQASSSASQ